MTPLRRGGGLQRKYLRLYRQKKPCAFCIERSLPLDYKAIVLLRKYMSDRAKIQPRRRTGTCAKHQRILAKVIKRARVVGLLPFVNR